MLLLWLRGWRPVFILVVVFWLLADVAFSAEIVVVSWVVAGVPWVPGWCVLFSLVVAVFFSVVLKTLTFVKNLTSEYPTPSYHKPASR